GYSISLKQVRESMSKQRIRKSNEHMRLHLRSYGTQIVVSLCCYGFLFSTGGFSYLGALFWELESTVSNMCVFVLFERREDSWCLGCLQRHSCRTLLQHVVPWMSTMSVVQSDNGNNGGGSIIVNDHNHNHNRDRARSTSSAHGGGSTLPSLLANRSASNLFPNQWGRGTTTTTTTRGRADTFERETEIVSVDEGVKKDIPTVEHLHGNLMSNDDMHSMAGHNDTIATARSADAVDLSAGVDIHTIEEEHDHDQEQDEQLNRVTDIPNVMRPKDAKARASGNNQHGGALKNNNRKSEQVVTPAVVAKHSHSPVWLSQTQRYKPRQPLNTKIQKQDLLPTEIDVHAEPISDDEQIDVNQKKKKKRIMPFVCIHLYVTYQYVDSGLVIVDDVALESSYSTSDEKCEDNKGDKKKKHKTSHTQHDYSEKTKDHKRPLVNDSRRPLKCQTPLTYETLHRNSLKKKKLADRRNTQNHHNGKIQIQT
ncbi:hypothetical protein RFI_12473, partial [Reticulomyxa filosa]